MREYFGHLAILPAFVVLMVVLPSLAFSQDVYFAGVSFAGDYGQNKQMHPVATKLILESDGNGGNVLDTALRKQLEGVSPKYFNLKRELIKPSNDGALVLAFALTDESVDEWKWGSKYVSVYRVHAQILAFDFNELKAVAMFPVAVKVLDAKSQRKSKAAHAQMFRKIYLDPSLPNGIFSEWVARLKDLKIKPSYKNYLQVEEVVIDAKNRSIIPADQLAGGVYEAKMAQLFGAILSSKAIKGNSVPLIPFTKGQAVGNKMAARFADGKSYQLNLPDPDYTVKLLIRPFKHLTKDTKEKKGTWHFFGAFITVKVEQPLMEKVYLDSKFKKIIRQRHSKSDKLNIWFGYQTAMEDLFVELSSQIVPRQQDALKKITKTKGIESQLKKFEKVIRKCI